MRFIKKVGDGQVDLEQIEKEKQHDAKKISEIWSADFASAWTNVSFYEIIHPQVKVIM